MPTCRVITYDLLDGSVNDAHTIGEIDIERDVLNYGKDSEILNALRDEGFKIPLGTTIDNSGDCGDRIELLNSEGNPAGAIAWDE